LNTVNIVYSKTQPKGAPDASAHVESTNGSNTIFLDPHGAGGDRTLDIIHENFHLDPPGFSDIEAAGALGKRFNTVDGGSKWWSPLLDAACAGANKKWKR